MKGIVLHASAKTSNTQWGEIEITDQLELTEPLGPKDVMVRIEAAGVCGSDVSLATGKFELPTPLVMGHEGAGVVTRIGEAVTACQVGDHVVLSTLNNCGHCPVCERGQPTLCGNPRAGWRMPFGLDGNQLYQFAQTSCFAEETIVREHQAVPIPAEVPFTAAALIGCGVITGAGAIFNRAKVGMGDTVAVVGAGGVGLSAMQAARLSGASRIVAIDVVADKQELAEKFGATDFILTDGGRDGGTDGDTGGGSSAEAVRELLPDGVDHAVEAVGSPQLLRECIDMTANGGNIVQLGVADISTDASYNMYSLYQNKTILGCRYGAARPRADFVMLAELYLQGKLLLDELVSDVASFDGLFGAFENIAAGKVARTVLQP